MKTLTFLLTIELHVTIKTPGVEGLEVDNVNINDKCQVDIGQPRFRNTTIPKTATNIGGG